MCDAILGLAGLAARSEEVWWSGGFQVHPLLDTYNAPYSRAKLYYPTNPRGYFATGRPYERDWRTTMERGSEGHLEFPPIDPPVARVVIDTLGSERLWAVTADMVHLTLTGGRRYRVTFRARADQPRRLAYQLIQAHEPWTRLGLYASASLTHEWQTFYSEFIANASETNAAVHFELGGSTTAVEIMGPTLEDVETGKRVVSAPSTENSIEYRFNGMGCRGPDYAMPRLPGTFRILALGDSYTLGYGVHEEDTFEVLLERLLDDSLGSRLGREFEVINCGANGYWTGQERLWYEGFLAKYEPDLVLINVVANDDRSWRNDVAAGYAHRPARPDFLSVVWHRVQLLRHRRPPADYSRTLQEVLNLEAFCRARGTRLGVIVFRNAELIHDWSKLVRAVREGLEGTGIVHLDLGVALLRNHTVEQLWAHDVDWHPNEIAQRIAARELYRFLIAADLLSSLAPASGSSAR